MDVADSSQVQVGQLVVAIGNPFGLGNTMTTGIVSAIARSIQAGSSSQSTTGGNFSIADVIQTDAPINPGNSGGVLVDMNGRLIGVPSQIESASGSNSGVGFAIPSSLVKKVVPGLIQNGKVSHSYLGISGTTLTADLVSTLNLKTGQQGILVVDRGRLTAPLPALAWSPAPRMPTATRWAAISSPASMARPSPASKTWSPT